VAKYCLIAQLVILLIEVGASQFNDPEPALKWLSQGTVLLLPAANVLMWLGVFAPLVYNWLRGRSDSTDQLLIIGQLADLLRVGMPLPEALECLSRHQSGSWRSRFSRGCQSLDYMSRTTAHGDRLGQAMERFPYFPAHWAGLLNAAEIRGVLIEVLDQLEAGRSSRGWFSLWFGIRLLLLWMVGFPLALFLVTYILPTFVALFEGMSLQLPWFTQLFIFLFKALRSPLGSLCLTLTPLLGVAVMLRAHFNEEFARRVKAVLYQLPPFSRVLPLEDQAAVATTLASCLRLGLSEGQALELAARAVQHPDYQGALRAQTGTVGIRDVLQQHPELFYPPLQWLATQGQLHGNMEDALSSAAVYLLEVAEEKKARWSVWLDSLAAMLLGSLALLIVVATMMPLAQLISTLVADMVLP
jgi:type IV pilus assembly protein PilC